MMEVFQGLGILKQHTHPGTAASTHHDRHRGRQTQRTGAGDDQNRNGTVQREFQSLARHHPNREGHGGDAHNDRHKHTGNLVRQTGDRGLGAAGILHHPDHLREGGILPHLIRPKFQIAFCIDGSGRNPVSRKLFHRDTFSGQSALVNGTTAGDHRAVHRDAAAGADDHRIPYPDIFHRDFLIHALPAYGGGFGTQVHQLPDGIACLALGPGLQELAQSDQRQDHRGRLKIQIIPVKLYRSPITVAHGIGHPEQGCHAVDQGRQRANGNQRVHVGSLVPQSLQTTGVVNTIQIDRGQRQKELQQRRHQGIFRSVIPMGLGQADHMAHGEVHQHHQTDGRTDDALLHFLQFVSRRIDIFLFRLFLTENRRTIAGFRHGGDDGRKDLLVLSIHHHGTGQQIHLCLSHAGHLIGHLLHPCGTGRAGHAGHIEFNGHKIPHFF